MRPYTPTAKIAAGDTAMLDVDPRNAATLRELLDARAHLRQITWGSLEWGGRIAVSGTAAHPVLACDQIDVVALSDSAGVWWPAYSGAVTIPESAMSLPLAPFTHYNVFAKVSTSGVLGFEVTTSAPDSAVYRTVSAEQRRLLASFVTDTDGIPRPGVARERGFTFRARTGDDLKALDAGHATSVTQVDLTTWAPARATVVHLVAYLANGEASARILAYGAAHGDGGLVPLVGAEASTNATAHVRLPLASRSIDYQALGATASSGLSLYVTGWEV